MKVLLISILIGGLTLPMFSACAVTRSEGSTHNDKDEIPTVTACQLLQKADRFHEKVVRISAVHEKGFEKSYLYDPECRSLQSQMWVSLDKSFVQEGDSEEAEKNRTISGFGTWFVTAVGRFRRAKGPERFGHLGCCRYQLDLIRIEKSEKLPEDQR
jgi:hypothetical protein